SGLWFVTRSADVRVIRLQPNTATKISAAQWTSWQLDPASVTTGGLKRTAISDDGRFAVIRTATSIQRVDTSNCGPGTSSTGISGTVCKLDVYPDSICLQDPNRVCQSVISDLAIDRNNNVYTAITFDPTQPVTS